MAFFLEPAAPAIYPETTGIRTRVQELIDAMAPAQNTMKMAMIGVFVNAFSTNESILSL
jgi:hypothetical protein